MRAKRPVPYGQRWIICIWSLTVCRATCGLGASIIVRLNLRQGLFCPVVPVIPKCMIVSIQMGEDSILRSETATAKLGSIDLTVAAFKRKLPAETGFLIIMTYSP